MGETCFSSNPEPLPWETSEYLEAEVKPQSYKCANTDCQNIIPTPSFCSEECRNIYYKSALKANKSWTLEEMQAWCKKKSGEARQWKEEVDEKAKIFAQPQGSIL